MSSLTAEMIKELRDRTGVGMAKCKEALVESDGNLDLAIEYLRKKGMASAVKKEGRETKEGSIGFSQTSEVIAFLEVCAETDFVVNNEKFQVFVREIAEQAAQAKTSSLEELLNTPYAKDPSLTVDQYKSLVIQSLAENIQVKRLELIEKKENSSYGIYSHMNGKIVTLVEIHGSTLEEAIAKDIAMHVAAEDPEYLTEDEIPSAVKTKEEDIAREQMKGKPAHVMDKIIAGKIKDYCNQNCLIRQKYIKDPSISVQQFLDAHAQKIGKPLKITRFLRLAIGL